MKPWRNHGPALWLLLILALVAAARIRMASMPLERDEGEYAYAGQLMLEGVPPYRLAYNMKMPGIYAAYAAIMAVFGQSAAGIRMGFMLVNFGAILLLYFVGRRFLDCAGAVAACAAYALLSLSPHVLGFAAHATHFVMLSALGGTLVLLRAQEKGRIAGYFWSGALFGIAFLMKQPGGAFAFFGCALIVWAALRRKPPQWKTDGLRLALYGTGVAAPIILTCLILWQAGVWDKFWWWTVTYAKVHATAMDWAHGRRRLANFFYPKFHWDEFFWLLALAGLFSVLARKGRADEKFFFLSLLLFSAAGGFPPFNFTSHYFVLLLPVVALLAAKACTPAASWLAAQPLRLMRWMPWIVFGAIWLSVVWSYRNPFAFLTENQVSFLLYPNNEFQVYPEIAAYLQRHSDPAATFAVIGSEPELLFEARRRSVTGYIYMYDLVQPQPFRERMEEEMLSEVELGRPDYIVFVNLVFSWMPSPGGGFDSIKNWVTNYTDRQYVPYGVVTFSPNEYYWGPDCLNHVPLSHRLIMIFQRRRLSGRY